MELELLQCVQIKKGGITVGLDFQVVSECNGTGEKSEVEE